MTFLERAAAGEFTNPAEAIKDAVGEWHDAPVYLGPLHLWLGFTWTEYGAWAKDSSALDDIIIAKRISK